MSTENKYRPDIDGLRAIAVLAVVAYHAAPGRMPGGFIGVDIFFVISGYLISSILLNSLDKGRFSILEFYERRVRRIFPALSLMLIACSVSGWFLLLSDEFKQLGKHTVAGGVFISNVALWNESGYFDDAADFKILLHLWSLGIEEQFYIFWPILLWVTYVRKWSIISAVLAIAICSFALNIHLSITNPSGAFYLPFPRFWELAVGALLATLPAVYRQMGILQLTNITNQCVSILGLLLLLSGFYYIDKQVSFPGWWALLPVSGTALLILSGPHAAFNRWVLSNPAMVWIGLISYPLYLWHWPILSFLRVMEGQEVVQIKRVIGVAVAFSLAWLTYRFIEMPVRKSSNKKSTVLVLLILMIAITLFGASIYYTNGFKNRSGNLPVIANTGEIGHKDYFAYIDKKFYTCTPKEILIDLKDIHCYQSKPSKRKTLALIGDSHAEHLFVGVAESLPEDNVVYYPNALLPFINNTQLIKTYNYILSEPTIDVVILNAIWIRKVELQKFSNWKINLRLTVDTLTSAGKTVFLVDDVPDFSFQPSRCKYSGRLGIDNKCKDPDSNGFTSYRPYFEEIARSNKNVKVIYTYESFCREGHCEMAEGGKLLYRDGHHLNLNGSKKIGAIIAREVNEFR